MKRIIFIIISLFIFAGCSYQCKDSNVIITTKSTAYSKINGNNLGTEPDTIKWHVRGDSVFICGEKADHYRPDTKLINDTLVTDSELSIIYWEK